MCDLPSRFAQDLTCHKIPSNADAHGCLFSVLIVDSSQNLWGFGRSGSRQSFLYRVATSEVETLGSDIEGRRLKRSLKRARDGQKDMSQNNKPKIVETMLPSEWNLDRM